MKDPVKTLMKALDLPLLFTSVTFDLKSFSNYVCCVWKYFFTCFLDTMSASKYAQHLPYTIFNHLSTSIWNTKLTCQRREKYCIWHLQYVSFESLFYHWQSLFYIERAFDLKSSSKYWDEAPLTICILTHQLQLRHRRPAASWAAVGQVYGAAEVVWPETEASGTSWAAPASCPQ